MITVQGICAEDAPAWWPVVSEWCNQALSKGCWTLDLEDVREAVAGRAMQLWIIHDFGKLTAVCVTEIRVWPKVKVLTAIIVAGHDMPKWVAALDDVLTRYGREQGCKVLDAHGRKGWTKTLKTLGWKDIMTTYAKRL